MRSTVERDLPLQPTQDSCIVSPAILLDVPDAADLWQDEVFGMKQSGTGREGVNMQSRNFPRSSSRE
jgi:hypothetical protein